MKGMTASCTMTKIYILHRGTKMSKEYALCKHSSFVEAQSTFLLRDSSIEDLVRWSIESDHFLAAPSLQAPNFW